MLNMAVRNTKKLVRAKVKEENVRLGRFFTKKPVAARMAEMITPVDKETVTVLDPGAGTGILSAALVERICQSGKSKIISLCCYENDAAMLPMLKDNLARIRRKARRDYGVKLVFSVKEQNYVLARQDNFLSTAFADDSAASFDYVIMNPPSVLTEKDAPEMRGMEKICAGATDMAFLFCVMAMTDLAEGGQFVALLPSAYANSVTLDKLRGHLLRVSHIERLHLFIARSKSGAHADSIRKELILKFVKSPVTDGAQILLSSSEDKEDAATAFSLSVPYGRIVDPENGRLLLIKSEEDLRLVEQIEALPCTMSSLGLRMHTGLTIESKYKEQMRTSPDDGAIPLITPRDIAVGLVRTPVSQYVVPRIPSLAQKNKNLLLIKRVPAKSDNRHLMCAVYLASQLPRFPMISTQNKLNYIDYDDKREMDSQLVHGLFAVLSSDIYESYCAILSKSAQVGAKEYGDLPLPDEKTLRQIGAQLLMARQYSPRMCTASVRRFLKIG